MSKIISIRDADYVCLKERSKAESRPMAAILTDAFESLRRVSVLSRITGAYTKEMLEYLQKTCGGCEQRMCMKMSDILANEKQADRANKLEDVILQQAELISEQKGQIERLTVLNGQIERLAEQDGQKEALTAIQGILKQFNLK